LITTISAPDEVEPDVLPGRERLYRLVSARVGGCWWS
jgi:hypothetical protein